MQVKKDKETTVTDIDVLVIVGNKAIIVQVKSKRLTALSRIGNEEKIKKVILNVPSKKLMTKDFYLVLAVVDKSKQTFCGRKKRARPQ